MTAARDPITPLQDIVKKAEQIERLIQGMTQEEFLHDERTQLALGMAFIDLGNAHSQLSAENPEAAAMFAQLEDTVGFRNVLAHHYEEVPPATLWKIARDPLPEIGRAAVSMLAELDPEGRHTAADPDATERQRSDREPAACLRAHLARTSVGRAALVPGLGDRPGALFRRPRNRPLRIARSSSALGRSLRRVPNRTCGWR